MQHQKNRPIFVVGSPRSGTSVLTWCLGQHPNIIPLEESGWMGDLAIDLAIYYQIGTARGKYSLLSSMGIHNAEFFSRFGETITELIFCHRVDLERERWRHAAGPDTPDHCFVPSYDTKTRWVDGTPEYSLHIFGLRKLFPDAQFVHVFRDATSVVRSMLHFHRVSGQRLVADAQEAYQYWLATVSNCALAERAYGPGVILRLRHADLVGQPKSTLESLFAFLGEPFVPECLEPLSQRINSSNVPADFTINEREVDPGLLGQAKELCQQLEASPQPREITPAAIEELEAAFNERVHFVTTLPREFRKPQEVIAILQQENRRLLARAERLALEVKGKRAIIEDLRARRERSRWLRSPFRALQETIQRSRHRI
jgi:hypothetical protein